MSGRFLALISAAALMGGLGFGVAQRGEVAPPPQAVRDVSMSYYLANQALFSGELAEAARHMARVQAEGLEPASLCPGVSFRFEVQGGSWDFCDPDAVLPPAEVRGYVAERLSQARALAEAGETRAALQEAEGALRADPYDAGAHALVATFLEARGEAAKAAEHRARLEAMTTGRVQAIEGHVKTRL